MTGLARWIPTVSMMLVSVISYIDRNTLALLIPTIQKETHMSAQEYGFIVSAFSIAYMLGNPLWGRLLDRLGVRLGMLAAVSLWSAASAGHALAAGFWSFGVARAVLGFGEGATFPGGLRTVVQTLPADSRARGIAIAYSGGSLGAIITPLLMTPVERWWGWRTAFLFTGAIGVAWLGWWLLLSRSPDLRRTPEVTATGASEVRFSDPKLWSALSAYALGALPLGFVLYNTSLYLSHARGLSQTRIGELLWIPPLGWEIGYFFWGWLCDRAVRSGRNIISSFRWLFGMAAVFSLPLALAPRLEGLTLLMSELFLAMFVTAGFIVPGIAYATRIYSTRHSGFIAGLAAGSYSAVVALTAPLFGRLFDQRRYDEAFALATLFPVLGFAIWAWINRRD